MVWICCEVANTQYWFEQKPLGAIGDRLGNAVGNGVLYFDHSGQKIAWTNKTALNDTVYWSRPTTDSRWSFKGLHGGEISKLSREERAMVDLYARYIAEFYKT